jgi:hypothetical protein
MARRVTFMIDDDLDKRLRGYQIKLMQNRNKTVSYSEVINEILEKHIRK